MLKLLKFGSWPASQRRWVIRIAVVFLVYSVVGFLVLPPLIKWQLVKQLPKSTKRVASVRQVLVNPWTLSLTIRGLKLNDPTGEPFASWEEFKANFQLSSLFRWAWTFKEIHLIDFRGAVVLQRDGKFNFANMFERTDPKPRKDDEVSRVRVFLLSITNGFVSLEDHTRRKPFRTEYRPINILVRNLTTRPGTGTPYSFHAENDTGKMLDWEGDITVAPFSSHGTIDLKNGEPHKYEPYLDDFTRAEIADGRVDIRTDYFVAAGTNGVDLVVTNGSVVLKRLKLNDPDVNEIVLSVPELALQELQFNLRERQLTAGLFKISDTEAVTRLNEDGSLNLARLLVARPTTSTHTPSTNASAPWTINLAHFQLTNATVKFEDRSRKTVFKTQLSPIDINLKNFTTRPESDSSYEFSILTEASEKIGGGGTVSVNPVRAAGEVTVAAIDVKKYSPFLEPFLHGEILSGKIDLNSSYHAARGTNSLSAFASNTVVRLTELQLKSPDSGETVVSIPELSVEGAEVNLHDRSAKIARAKTADGSVLLRRETDGRINLVSLLQPSEKSALPAPSSENTVKTSKGTPPVSQNTNSPWTALIEEIAVENYSINLEDNKTPKPAAARLDQLSLNLKTVGTEPEKPISHTLAFRLNESASVRAEGTLTPRPLSADVELSITNLDLRALQPYLEQRARVELSHGTFNLASHAKLETTASNAMHLNFTGGLSIAAFAAVDQLSQDILKWTNLTVDGIKLELQPDNLHIDSVRFEGLVGNLLINSNKEVNIRTVFVKDTNASAISTTPAVDSEPARQPAKPPSQGPVPFPITVDKFELADSAFRVKDVSVQPPAEVEIQQVSGAITGLSSDPKASAEVNLAGSVGDRSPLSITGRINPLAGEPQLNLTVSNSNVQLSQFTPYMEKYTGHPLNRGRLSMTLHYEVQGKQLTAKNNIELEQLTLGPRQENPTATDLPVKLGVALLKDSQGRISLDVPVSGRLDDPQFRVGPIIMKVIVNMITKAVASPFKLIGAAVGGGDELSFLAFEPGTADFIEGETNKIGKLIKALNGRPGLSLDITAFVDPKHDRDAVARQLIQEEIKTARLDELEAVGQAPADPDTFEVEPGENLRLLRARITEKFGTNLNQAIREMKAAMTNTASGSASESESSATGQKQKWYKKMSKTVLIPFQKKNSPEAAARRQAKADTALLKENPELGALSGNAMEILLASKLEVPQGHLLKLMKDRAEAAHTALLNGGELAEDRVLLVAPKPMKEGYRGEARVELSLN